ncbi:MAG: hypothetical protein COB67_02570 [SAR324 cluster bacterium]|uniref:Uncharacterized protein n=1 Tax=SAR324 cluster bacterium TaxID=2024889 RepID=A0A2A4TA47_9DELT|nr:MAG: hypothetical protein COB67_02570 [SAR324 cluster bacterium]
MTAIQIVTLQFEKEKTLDHIKRVMIEKLGEDVYRVYNSVKEDGKVFSPFELSKEIYDSAAAALQAQSFSSLSKVVKADNNISDLLTTEEIKSALDLNDITES